jgi:hypothetical protein
MSDEKNPAVHAEALSEAVAHFGKLYFNNFITDTVDDLYAKYGHQGYNKHGDFTDNFSFQKHSVKAHLPPYTMCVSCQFEIILKAVILYCEKTKDASPYNYIPMSKWFGLNGLTLQNCVWENEHCHSVGKALSLFGMGEIADFSQLIPGSFISYDHGSGGHSVCFLGFLDANAKITPTYNEKVVGFRFFSSNGSGVSGEGMSYRDGVFAGRKMKQGSFKQAAGIKNLRCGMMYNPQSWRKEKFDYFSLTQDALFDNTPPSPPTGQP